MGRPRRLGRRRSCRCVPGVPHLLPAVPAAPAASAARGAVFPNRATVGRLNANNELEPYHDRAAIEAGALDGQRLEICWIRDPWDVMTIQIQGSARVRLEDGTLLRV